MSRDIKYIGMDVHKEATVIAVLNVIGKLVMESIVETKASSILQFIHGLRGELHVTWEEGTWAAWLYDLLQPKVARVLVCDPRRNALLKGKRQGKHTIDRFNPQWVCRFHYDDGMPTVPLPCGSAWVPNGRTLKAHVKSRYLMG